MYDVVANAGALKERLRRLERYGTGDHHPSEAPIHAEASVVIFDLADVEDIDASACQLMLEAVESYVVRSVLVRFFPRCTADLLGLNLLSF